MGLGGTAKKIQRMVEIGEEIYQKLNEVRAQLNDLTGTVEETGARVETLEAENAKQRALLEAIAEERGIDPQAILAEGEAGNAAKSTEAADGAPVETEGMSADNNP